MYRVNIMKNKILFLLAVSTFSTNLFAKTVSVIVKNPIVNPGFHDTTWFTPSDLEVKIMLAGCKTNERGRFSCENYLQLGELTIDENDTDQKVTHELYEEFTFNTDALTEAQRNDPNLGIYFVTDGNIDRFSQTGLLGTCIRRIIKGEAVKNTCKAIRNGNGVSLELEIDYADSGHTFGYIPSANE